MSAPKPGRPAHAYPPRDDRLAADRRRYDFALGIDLAIALSLSFILALRIALDAAPQGRDLLIWAAGLGVVWAVVACGVALHRADRTPGATAALALLAGPAAVLGIALAPVALFSVSAAASAPAEFRNWVGPDLPSRLATWAVILSFLGALVPASLLTRLIGRHLLGRGITVGAFAMISVVLIGISGGFLFRDAR
jgi:hypothetical protein